MGKQIFVEPKPPRPIGRYVLRPCPCGQSVYALPEQPAADVRCHGCVSKAKRRNK